MKKILVLLSVVLGLSVSAMAQTDWAAEYENSNVPAIRKVTVNESITTPTVDESGYIEPKDETTPVIGTSPVGALALPFAAMLGLYGVAALRKKEE